jgi:hypothetical protein
MFTCGGPRLISVRTANVSSVLPSSTKRNSQSSDRSASDADYLATKGFYHDQERLLAARRPGKGAQTLLLELLEAVRRNDLHTATVGEVNAYWRTVAKWT